ncbi:MAG: ATP-binding cassette domain-containing protein, partial [Blautia obeum]|nr:ATP-binding cassette domain-containing protein [Blautia obeum]
MLPGTPYLCFTWRHLLFCKYLQNTIFCLKKKEERLVIEVNNLVKRYGDHTAVDHLSFKIEKGKIYGFLGPNGAGKSTTMNMITGYIASTEGTVTI